MKKWLKSFSVCIVILFCFGPYTAYADENGSVLYDGDAKRFIFEPGTEHSPDDLFPAFKNMMPGEEVSQKILIKNISTKSTVNIYLRSLGTDEYYREFLSYLSLEVENEEGKRIFYDTPDNTSSLTDWVYLGSFEPGGESVLDLKVKVSEKLGNEYQDAVGTVKWEFKVEEADMDDSSSNSWPGFLPQTGGVEKKDWIIAAAGAALILLGVLIRPRK